MQELPDKQLLEILEEELPVYGNFLRFYKIELGLLPISKGTPLFRVGSLYSRLKGLHCGMLHAYVMQAMFKSGFMNLYVVEEAKDEYVPDEAEALEWGRDYMEHTISDYMFGFFDKEHLELCVNTENPKEAINVLSVCADFPPRKLEADNLIEKLEEEKLDQINSDTGVDYLASSSVECIADFIIIDPLLFRTRKEEVNSLKQEIADKMGKDIVYHPSEFLSQLAIDRTDFDAEWSSLHRKAVENLKEEYEFLVLCEENETVHEVQEEMRMAENYIERENYEEAVWRGGKACEGLLHVLYHTYKKKQAEEEGFNSLLTALREEILDDFKEDVFNDLDYIREQRNRADHAKKQKIMPEDAVKVVRKAQLFQELFFRKMKGKL
jgi:hypothetical protein